MYNTTNISIIYIVRNALHISKTTGQASYENKHSFVFFTEIAECYSAVLEQAYINANVDFDVDRNLFLTMWYSLFSFSLYPVIGRGNLGMEPTKCYPTTPRFMISVDKDNVKQFAKKTRFLAIFLYLGAIFLVKYLI